MEDSPLDITSLSYSLPFSPLPASPSRLPASPSRLPASPSRLPASPSRLTASPSRLTASPSRLTASPSRLPPSPLPTSAFASSLTFASPPTFVSAPIFASASSPTLSKKRRLEENTRELVNELITKRFKEFDTSTHALYYDLKEEIKAQGETISRQAHDIEELAVENAELHEEVETLKDDIEELKEAIQIHGDSLRGLDGQVSSLLFSFGDLFPSFS